MIIIIDPHLVLFLASYMAIEIAIASVLYDEKIPNANRGFKAFRAIMVIFISVGVSSLIFYNPIKYKHILTLLLLLATLTLGLISVILIDEALGNLLILASLLSFVLGFVIGAYSIPVGLTVIIAFIITKKSPKMIDKEIGEKIWRMLTKLYIQHILALLDFVISVLMYHGYIFF